MKYFSNTLNREITIPLMMEIILREVGCEDPDIVTFAKEADKRAFALPSVLNVMVGVHRNDAIEKFINWFTETKQVNGDHTLKARKRMNPYYGQNQ